MCVCVCVGKECEKDALQEWKRTIKYKNTKNKPEVKKLKTKNSFKNPASQETKLAARHQTNFLFTKFFEMMKYFDGAVFVNKEKGRDS